MKIENISIALPSEKTETKEINYCLACGQDLLVSYPLQMTKGVILAFACLDPFCQRSGILCTGVGVREKKKKRIDKDK